MDLDDHCENCGAVLPVDRYSWMRKFCSAACKVEDKLRLEHAAVLDARRGRSCAMCDREIPLTRNAAAIYCSVACGKRAEYRRGKMVDRARARRDRPCAICGATVPETSRKGTLYCGRDCQAEAQRRAVRRYRARISAKSQ